MPYKNGDRVYVVYDVFGVEGYATLKSDRLRDGTYAAEFDFTLPCCHNCGGLTKNDLGIWVFDRHIRDLVSPTAVTRITVDDQTPCGGPQKDKYDPLSEQVGGGHYKGMKIQPVEFILANELGFCEGNAIKYICRYKQKGGVEDLKKVIHYAQLLIADLEKSDK